METYYSTTFGGVDASVSPQVISIATTGGPIVSAQDVVCSVCAINGSTGDYTSLFGSCAPSGDLLVQLGMNLTGITFLAHMKRYS